MISRRTIFLAPFLTFHWMSAVWADDLKSASPSLTSGEISQTYTSKTLSDEQVVQRFAIYLDWTMALPTSGEPLRRRTYQDSDIVRLIPLMAFRPWPRQPRERPEAIQAVLNRLDSLPGLYSRAETRRVLNIALGYAKGKPSETELRAALDDPQMPPELLNLAVRAMARSRVPLRALPRLLELSQHPLSFIDGPMDCVTQPPQFHRVFPLREAVHEALRRLGIQSRKIRVPDKKPTPEARNQRLSTLKVQVDRASLLAQLRRWISSDDPEIWRAAMDVSAQIPGDDVKRLREQLRQNPALALEARIGFWPNRGDRFTV